MRHVFEQIVWSLPDCGSRASQFGARVDANDLALELEQAPDECLGDVARAKDDDPPRLRWLYVSKYSFTTPPQVMPTSRCRFHSTSRLLGAVVFVHHLWASSNRLLFDLAAADGAEHEAARSRRASWCRHLAACCRRLRPSSRRRTAAPHLESSASFSMNPCGVGIPGKARSGVEGQTRTDSGECACARCPLLA